MNGKRLQRLEQKRACWKVRGMLASFSMQPDRERMPPFQTVMALVLVLLASSLCDRARSPWEIEERRSAMAQNGVYKGRIKQ